MNGFLVISEIKLWFLSFLHFTRRNEKISFKNLCQRNETRKMHFFCPQFVVKTMNCQQFNEQTPFFCFPSPTPTKGHAPVESGKIPSTPPPVPTSFALRASTMTLIELESITKNKHPVSFILKTWQTWNPAFCSCSNTCIFPWKTNSSHFGTKLYRFDQSHQRDIIP